MLRKYIKTLKMDLLVMKNKTMYFIKTVAFIVGAVLFVGCSDDDDGPTITGDNKVYSLGSVSDPSISGQVSFNALSDGNTSVEITLNGTPNGAMHPAHIHMNTAAEGGDIAVSLTPVNGTTGTSTTIVNATDDGSPITYDELLSYDGYINVHLSEDDLATLVAQGDIGQNELTGASKTYNLETRDVDGISGMALFEERVNGEALATLMLDGTPDGGMHPSHIHMNTAAEGGDIAFSFNPVNGTTGMSKTNVATLDDGSSFLYDDVFEYDGYINVHLSADELAIIVAQGDIGQNELTGESKSYTLSEKDVDGISGTALFEERVNGEALATLMLDGTPDGGMHPAHIHMNTAAEGGGILFTFTPVDGTSGMSVSNVAVLDDGTMLGYSDVLDIDGYINVHLSEDDLATIVAQGDIGQNELTGNNMTYDLNEVDVAGVTGTATFSERVNSETLVTIALSGITFAGDHPSHIHLGSVAEAPGAIAVSLTFVNTMGMSATNVTMDENGQALSYEDLIDFDGYINVHQSEADLATLVAQGDIGANAN